MTDGKNKKSIAVIIPALNEEATIAEVVEKCFASLSGIFKRVEIIVVDDGSNDNTSGKAEKAGASVLKLGRNNGVGFAFRKGLAHALKCGADIIVNIDADGQFDPSGIPHLVEPILAGRANVAIASRFIDPSLTPEMPLANRLGNRIMSAIISTIGGRKFYDVSCGFRAYDRDSALMLNLWGNFTYTQESILDFVVKGRHVVEVPIRIKGPRAFGKSRVANNLWKYGIKAAKIILHTYRDYWPLRFFGWISVPLMIAGVSLVAFLICHRLLNGAFSPHIWAGFTGAGLFAVGLLIFISGLIGESLRRIRLNQEMILYYLRRGEYDKGNPEN